MASAAQAVRIYRDLAEWHQQQGQPQQRDRFLVLAADAALAAGQGEEAERLRLRLLQLNPHHLLKPYATFAEAVRAGDVQSYLTALRQSHPSEAAERLLASLRVNSVGDSPSSDGEQPVFRVRRDEEQPIVDPPRPRQVPPPPVRPTPLAVPLAQPLPQPAPQPKPRSAPPPRPSTRPDVFAEEPEPHPLPTRRPRLLDPEEPSTSGSSVVPSILYALVLMVAVGLAIWALVRPFFVI